MAGSSADNLRGKEWEELVNIAFLIVSTPEEAYKLVAVILTLIDEVFDTFKLSTVTVWLSVLVE
jgi:hypothetical protein